MSDDERDIDVDESDAEKRAHHNALERKRRDHIKDSFTALRDAVPSLQGEKVASRAQILKKAAEYITFMKRKNQNHQQDNDDLKRQNNHLDQQIRQLERQLNASGDDDIVDFHGDQNSSESEMSMEDEESPIDIVTTSSQLNSFRNGASSSSGNRRVKTCNAYNSKVIYQ